MARPKRALIQAVQLELMFDEMTPDPSPPTPAVKHAEPTPDEAPRRPAAKAPPKEGKALPKLLPRRV